MNSIYLDYNATTPIDPEVRIAMRPFLEENFGNPSSFYRLGRSSEEALTKSRNQVAKLLRAQASEIIFTSCATESITTAFLSALRANPSKRHIVTSAVEHSATLQLCREYEKQGYDITYLPVNTDGNLSLQKLEEAITPSTALVSLLWANNETGVIFPIEKVASITTAHDVPLHLDAVQAVGKIAIDLTKLSIQYLSLSGHKLYAPKGTGALYVHRHAFYTPLLRGSQENERRGGTENMASLVALGEAADLAQQRLLSDASNEATLRNYFEDFLCTHLEGTQINGRLADRLPNTASITFHGIDGASALFLFDQEGLYCSAGSACNTQSRSPSHVLSAMGHTPEQARATLRFSLGRFTTKEEVDSSLEIILRVIKKLQSL